jgi:hypothetical protein
MPHGTLAAAFAVAAAAARKDKEGRFGEPRG